MLKSHDNCLGSDFFVLLCISKANIEQFYKYYETLVTQNIYLARGLSLML